MRNIKSFWNILTKKLPLFRAGVFFLFFDFFCDFLKIFDAVCNKGVCLTGNVFYCSKKIFVFSEDHKGIEALAAAVEASFDGHPADFGFQCTGNPVAHANIYKFIRNGGGLCELGFFINGGDATINPHFDICAKELTMVGSWVYTLRDYATTFDFLKRAKGIGLPMEKLITHKYALEDINEALKTNLEMKGLKIAIVNR